MIDLDLEGDVRLLGPEGQTLAVARFQPAPDVPRGLSPFVPKRAALPTLAVEAKHPSAHYLSLVIHNTGDTPVTLDGSAARYRTNLAPREAPLLSAASALQPRTLVPAGRVALSLGASAFDPTSPRLFPSGYFFNSTFDLERGVVTRSGVGNSLVLSIPLVVAERPHTLVISLVCTAEHARRSYY